MWRYLLLFSVSSLAIISVVTYANTDQHGATVFQTNIDSPSGHRSMVLDVPPLEIEQLCHKGYRSQDKRRNSIRRSRLSCSSSPSSDQEQMSVWSGEGNARQDRSSALSLDTATTIETRPESYPAQPEQALIHSLSMALSTSDRYQLDALACFLNKHSQLLAREGLDNACIAIGAASWRSALIVLRQDHTAITPFICLLGAAHRTLLHNGLRLIYETDETPLQVDTIAAEPPAVFESPLIDNGGCCLWLTQDLKKLNPRNPVAIEAFSQKVRQAVAQLRQQYPDKEDMAAQDWMYLLFKQLPVSRKDFGLIIKLREIEERKCSNVHLATLRALLNTLIAMDLNTEAPHPQDFDDLVRMENSYDLMERKQARAIISRASWLAQAHVCELKHIARKPWRLNVIVGLPIDIRAGMHRLTQAITEQQATAITKNRDLKIITQKVSKLMNNPVRMRDYFAVNATFQHCCKKLVKLADARSETEATHFARSWINQLDQYVMMSDF